MSQFFSGQLSQLAPYTPGEQPKDKNYVKLNANESPYPPSPAWPRRSMPGKWTGCGCTPTPRPWS